MDKKETNDCSETIKEETFVINLNQNDEVEEERMENKSNLGIGDTLTDEEYFLECARDNDVDELLHFIKQGFNIDSTDQRKNTALHMAAANGHLNAVKVLITNKINVNLKNESGNTALHWAAFNGFFDVIKYLFENNIDILITNQDGKMASQMAYEKGFFDISEYLIEKELAIKKDDFCKVIEEEPKENESSKNEKNNDVK